MYLGPGIGMPPIEINLYDQELLSIIEKGDCYEIIVAGEYSSDGNYISFIRKEELVGIYLHKESIVLYFKTFPSMRAKISRDKKIMEGIHKFMKKFINNTQEIDLLSL